MEFTTMRIWCYVGTSEHDPTPVWATPAVFSNPNGFSSFGPIYRGRPAASRFAVVEVDKPPRFIVIDLFEVQLNRDAESWTFPEGSTWTFPTLDAAIMTAKLKL